MSSSEYVEWIVYLDQDINNFHREDYYFASLTAEVRRGWVKDKDQVDMKDFIIKFESEKEVKETTKEEASRSAKRFFGVLLEE